MYVVFIFHVDTHVVFIIDIHVCMLYSYFTLTYLLYSSLPVVHTRRVHYPLLTYMFIFDVHVTFIHIHGLFLIDIHVVFIIAIHVCMPKLFCYVFTYIFRIDMHVTFIDIRGLFVVDIHVVFTIAVCTYTLCSLFVIHVHIHY